MTGASNSTNEARAALEALQQERLERVLARSFERSAFQRRRLEAAGLRRAPTVAEFPDLPLTTKAHIAQDQAEHAPYGTNLCDPLESVVRLHQTSSTSGARPLCRLDSAASWQRVLDAWEEVWIGAGIGPGDRVLFAFSFGPFLGFWAGFDAAARRGCLVLPGGALDSQGRLEALARHRVEVLACTPTYAIRLGELARELGQEAATASVRALVVAGETGGSVPAVRAHLESLWQNARVFDHYGLTEVGPVAYQCQASSTTLHVVEEWYLAELLDPRTEQPVACTPGAEGELVLTNLAEVTSPLLRYRTGDRVRVAATDCACGSPRRALDAGVLGRADDMVIVRGVNVFPAAVDEIVRSVGGVAEYRVHVLEERGMVELSLEVEPAEGVDGVALGGRIARAIRTGSSLAVKVVLAAPGSLPRFELKARRWVRRP